MIELYDLLNLMIEQEKVYRMKHKRIPRISIAEYEGMNPFIRLDTLTPSKAMTTITDTYDLYASLRHATVITINPYHFGDKDIRDSDFYITVKTTK